MKTGKQYKICRRLGSPIYEKCQTAKFAQSVARKGGRSDKKPKQQSDFGLQLIEKQKVRFSYGVSEKQFSNYVEKAVETKGVPPTEKLFELLERRLDNVVYRLGLASTRALARQLVSHGHITVAGRKVTIPSYQVVHGDMISVRDGSRKSALFTDIAKKYTTYTWPNWLTFDTEKLTGTIAGSPKNADSALNFNAVLEYYTR